MALLPSVRLSLLSCLLWYLPCAAAAHSRFLRHGQPLDTCSCDCCDAEPRREEQQGTAGGMMLLECAYTAGGQTGQCGEMCTRLRNDVLLQAAEAAEIDMQRFCFFECAPHAPAPRRPQAGDPCRQLSHIEARAVRDLSGNAVPPMESQSLKHLFLTNVQPMPASMSSNLALVGGAATMAASPAPGPSGEWSTAQLIPAQAAQATAFAEAAAQSAVAAFQQEQVLGNLTFNAENAVSTALVAAAAASAAAKDAEAAESEVHTLRDAALNASRRIAFAAIPEVLATLKTEARSEARLKAEQQAALMSAS
mmetsp:Transcript_53823/g.125818  ORF Transcript_53823/g.125818 Transcript_53823/m.125818 type:complete len:308 (-) Transcript_53823:77-1000(-)